MSSESKQSGKIRVLYVARAPFISGAERALMSMLRHLDRGRVEPYLVLGHKTGLTEIAKELDVPTTVLPWTKRSLGAVLPWWRSVRALGTRVDQFQPDLLHANDVPSCQAMSVVGHKRGLPRLVHVRWGISAEQAGWWARRGAERLICISDWVKNELGRTEGTQLEDAEAVVLPDSVDWPSRAGDGEGTNDSTLRSGDEAIDNKPPVIAFAGQLIESKGLDLVIRAMGTLPVERRPRLRVAGEDTQTGGAYQRRLERLASECGVDGQISWLGFVDDVSEVYRAATAVVCPSTIEPLGLIPLEAAEYRKPTLANRLGGFLETIEDGLTGCLVEPTVEGWAEALSVVWDRPRIARMGAAAYERTKRLYSPMAYQESLMTLYTKALTGAAKRRGARSPHGAQPV